MWITFSCEHCSKSVKAPEQLAGKKGRCPYCRRKMVIPSSPEPSQDLELAALERELHRSGADDGSDSEAETPSWPYPQPKAVAIPADSFDPDAALLGYMVAMGAGDLDTAGSLATELRQNPEEMAAAIRRLDLGTISQPVLRDLPRPVLEGFLKQLVD